MWVYQGHLVSLLWQSKQARSASALVWGESQFGSWTMGGFVFLTGMNWTPIKTSSPAASTTTKSEAMIFVLDMDKPLLISFYFGAGKKTQDR
jgi:hypothetical protein